MSRDSSRWLLRRVFRLPLTRARARMSVDEELRFHLEGRTEELMAQGLGRAEAEAEARRRFGDAESYRQATAAIDEQIIDERHRMDLLGSITREARQAARDCHRGSACARAPPECQAR